MQRIGWVRGATDKISREPRYEAKTLEEAVEKVLADVNQPRSWESEHFPQPFTAQFSDQKQQWDFYGNANVPHGDTAIVVVAANGKEYKRMIYRPTAY